MKRAIQESRGLLGGVAIVLLLVAGCDRRDDVVQAPTGAAVQSDQVTERPNILVIMADDLGYSDIGAFGSEIATPSLDRLAEQGLKLTNFHVHALCTPTRAMLLSGINNHAAGIGSMAGEARGAQKGAPGYEAYLRPEVVTIPELLQGAGYQTYIAGKWDLGGRADDKLLPENRGFDQSYVLVEGSSDHFRAYQSVADLDRVHYRHNGKPIELPDDFYSTYAYTDQMLAMLQQHDTAQPFFAFLSYTAPHYPLQAPDVAIARYAGFYEDGYEAIVEARLRRMRELGIIEQDMRPAPAHDAWPEWSDLNEQQRAFEVKRMQVYAAMVDEMDRGIGKVVEFLETSGQLDNTLILFMSDNGPEGGNPLDWWDYFEDWAIVSFDLSLENLGRKLSYAWTGPGWAQVSATPFGLYKGFASEGGTRVPGIIHWPAGLKRHGGSDEFVHVLDLPSTFLDLAGSKHPGTADRGFGNRALEGKSMGAYLTGKVDSIHDDEDVFVWEMIDRRAVRKGDWKLTWANKPWGKGLGNWSLFNMATDPTELKDLSGEEPEKVAELLVHWEDYVERNGLILIPEGIDTPWTNALTHYEWAPIPARKQPNKEAIE